MPLFIFCTCTLFGTRACQNRIWWLITCATSAFYACNKICYGPLYFKTTEYRVGEEMTIENIRASKIWQFGQDSLATTAPSMGLFS